MNLSEYIVSQGADPSECTVEQLDAYQAELDAIPAQEDKKETRKYERNRERLMLLVPTSEKATFRVFSEVIDREPGRGMKHIRSDAFARLERQARKAGCNPFVKGRELVSVEV